MKMLSNEHCVVDLKYLHPKMGILIVERFQRKLKDLQEMEKSKVIVWQGLKLNINSIIVVGKDQVPNMYCEKWYTITVDDVEVK